MIDSRPNFCNCRWCLLSGDFARVEEMKVSERSRPGGKKEERDDSARGWDVARGKRGMKRDIEWDKPAMGMN